MLVRIFLIAIIFHVILIQTNISNEEYVRMLRVYEESVVQTEVLSSLQKAMETEEHLTIQKQLPRKSQLKPTGNSTYLFGKILQIGGIPLHKSNENLFFFHFSKVINNSFS